MPLYIHLSCALLVVCAVAQALPAPTLHLEAGFHEALRRAALVLAGCALLCVALVLLGAAPGKVLAPPAGALASVGYALWLVTVWLPRPDDGGPDEEHDAGPPEDPSEPDDAPRMPWDDFDRARDAWEPVPA